MAYSRVWTGGRIARKFSSSLRTGKGKGKRREQLTRPRERQRASSVQGPFGAPASAGRFSLPEATGQEVSQE